MVEVKNVIITGANGGIGRALVQEFAKHGYNIYANLKKANNDFDIYINDMMNKYNIKIIPLYFDITDYEKVKFVINENIISKNVSVDVLINNAGITHGGFLQMTKLETIKDVFETNFFSLVNISQIISRYMQRNRKGTIVNLGSVAGLDLEVGNVAYGTSKAAVMAFTKTLAKELAPYNIRVNAVAPSLIDTNMAKQMEKNAGEQMIKNTAFKRLGSPGEVAKAIYFLASDNASFITGQILRVDGGM